MGESENGLAAARIRITCLGDLHFEVDGLELNALASQRQRSALLVYLGVERDATRDELLALLWPEQGDDRARHNLSQTIYELRRSLGADWLESSGDRVRLSDAVQCDAEEFSRYVNDGAFDDALRLYQGEFLQGLFLTHSQPFEAWVEQTRARLARLHRKARRDQINHLVAAGDLGRALAAAQVWVDSLPLEDEAQHRLIELLALSGRRAEAIQQYEDYTHRLKAEQLEPLQQTMELIQRIREGDVAAVDLPRIPRRPAREVVTTARAAFSRSRKTVGATAVIGGVILAATLYSRGVADFQPPSLPCEDQPGGCEDIPIDTLSYLVMPLRQESGWGEAGDGALLGFLIRESLIGRPGVHLTDPIRANDAISRLPGGRRLEVNSVLNLARRVGAGRVILGELRGKGDSAQARVVVYDSRFASSPLASATIPLGVGTDLQELAGRIADSLLPRHPVSGARTETSVATVDYNRGEAALIEWDLPRAAAHFRRAVASDPSLAKARLRLAHTLSMAGDTGSEFRSTTREALHQADQFDEPDELLLKGLDGLARRDYPTACEEFSRLLTLDSLSFGGWLGLGDCHAFDTLVLSDSASVSGWRFRSSYHAAIDAYRRALAFVPSFNFAQQTLGTSRLRDVLSLDPSRPRRGTDRAGELFFAFAAIAAGSDTLSFVPYHWTTMLSGRPGLPGEYAAGTMRIRQNALRVAQVWVAAFPQSPEALEAYALALESIDAIRARPGSSSALLAVREAERLTVDPAQRFRLAMMRLRFLLKTEDFRHATRLADSLLKANRVPPPDHAEQLAAAAALRGDVSRTVELLALETPRLQTEYDAVPASALEDHLRLLGYAALGWPLDSLRILWRRVEDRIRAGVAPQQQELVLAQLNTRAASLSFRTLGPTVLHRPGPYATWRLLLQAAQARGDTAAVRAGVAKHQSAYLDIGPQPATIDTELDVALLALAAGDTAAAIRTLDSVLNNLGMTHPRLTADVAQAASLVHMMVLRSRLAAARADAPTMRRWTRAADELWRNGDSYARSVVQGLRDLKPRR